MAETVTMIRHNLVAQRQPLPLDRRLKDAIAEYFRARWPQGTAKMVAREFDLTLDAGKSVVCGKCSWESWDAIIFHKRGGWHVVFPVYGIALEQTAEQFIIAERKSHEERARRLGALLGDWGPMASARPDTAPDLDDGQGERPRSFSSRVGSRASR